MSGKWYDELPDDFFESEEDRAYRSSFAKIREGLEQGLGFDEACAGIDVEDELLRRQIIDDMLKVILAEEHFTRKVTLGELAQRLKVPEELLEKTKQSMLEEVEKNGSFL